MLVGDLYKSLTSGLEKPKCFGEYVESDVLCSACFSNNACKEERAKAQAQTQESKGDDVGDSSPKPTVFERLRVISVAKLLRIDPRGKSYQKILKEIQAMFDKEELKQLKISELREIAEEFDVETEGKKKSALISDIVDAQEEFFGDDAVETDVEEEVEVDDAEEEEDLSSMKYGDLIKLAKSLGLKFKVGTKKVALIEMIEGAQDDVSEDAEEIEEEVEVDDAEEEEDLSSMKTSELRKVALALGLKFKAGTKKSEMIEKIEAARAVKAAETEVEEEEGSEEISQVREDLKNSSLREIKNIATSLGIEIKGKKRTDLIDEIEQTIGESGGDTETDVEEEVEEAVAVTEETTLEALIETLKDTISKMEAIIGAVPVVDETISEAKESKPAKKTSKKSEDTSDSYPVTNPELKMFLDGIDGIRLLEGSSRVTIKVGTKRVGYASGKRLYLVGLDSDERDEFEEGEFDGVRIGKSGKITLDFEKIDLDEVSPLIPWVN